MTDIEVISGELLKRLRTQKGFSRGQVARRLACSPTVVYNMETGRSRIPLSSFFRYLEIAGFKPTDILRRHSSSVQASTVDPAALIQRYRRRLHLSQKKLADALGYASSSMVHHFEKGIREPSIMDFFRIAELAGDNIGGMIVEITGDEEFAKSFPVGTEIQESRWEEYWSAYYISAVRQVMRTQAYRKLKKLRLGYFSKVLGITYNEESRALAVLSNLGLIKWQAGKPEIDPSVNIVIPKGIPKETLDNIKSEWVDFNRQGYLKGGEAILTIDTLPVSRENFEKIVELIRSLQDDIHNTTLDENTSGIACFSWLAHYVPADKVKSGTNSD